MAFTLGAAGISALGGIAGGLLGRGGAQAAADEKAAYDRAALLNAMAQQGVSNQLATQGLARSTAGYTDSMGNQYSYDPGSNTWRMTMGALPAEVQRAMYGAAIQRNVTDMANAALANEIQMRTGVSAQPGVDAARAAVANVQPVDPSTLTQLMTRNIINATNATQQPILSGMLSQGVRTGTGMGTQLADYSRQQAQNVRDAISQATIQGMTGAGEASSARLAPYMTKLQASGAIGPSPNIQTPGIASTDPNAQLLSAMTQRETSAGQLPFYGQSGASSAGTGVTTAAGLAAGGVPPSTTGTDITSVTGQIADLLKNKDLTSKISSWFGGSGDGSPSTITNAFGVPTSTRSFDYKMSY